MFVLSQLLMLPPIPPPPSVLSQSVSQSVTHSLTRSLSHSLTHSLTHSQEMAKVEEVVGPESDVVRVRMEDLEEKNDPDDARVSE